ncbi:DUF6106 family protein [Ethanoligenens sp.]|uniref:DUF6106 family protein n=1 Tax=Ethanoligenens sp. TaxID=2099655 RepID=UPI0039E951E9
MDTHVEYLVKRHVDSSTLALKILIVLASAVLGVGLLFISLTIPVLSSLGILALVLCIWGGWMLLRRFQLEYEYILTNFDLDVDKIVAQRKRKRMMSIDLHRIDQFARFDENHRQHVESAGIQKRLDASTHVNGETWYLIFNHKELGKTLLLFSPDERIQQAVKKAKPQAVL